MKFKIYLETNSPAEKALTPLLKIDISSENASPERVSYVLGLASATIMQLKDALDSLKEKRLR